MKTKREECDLITEETEFKIQDENKTKEYIENYFENLYQAREGDTTQTHWSNIIQHKISRLDKHQEKKSTQQYDN